MAPEVAQEVQEVLLVEAETHPVVVALLVLALLVPEEAPVVLEEVEVDHQVEIQHHLAVAVVLHRRLDRGRCRKCHRSRALDIL